MDNQVEIIKLPPFRWREYKALRLTSLQTDPEAWEHTYDHVSSYPDQTWQNRLNQALDEKTDLYLFAQAGEKLVGMMGAFWNTNNPKSAHVATIITVYVLPDYRKQGIAKKLMQQLLDKLQSKAYFTKFKLFAVTTQIEAVKLYQSFGFEIAGKLTRELKINGQYFDEYLMEKFLD